jgi:hypothetical protein
MKKFLPLLLSGGLMIGGVIFALARYHGVGYLSAEQPVFLDGEEPEDVIEREAERRLILEDRMEEVARRLSERSTIIESLLSQSITIHEAYQSFLVFHRDAQDPILLVDDLPADVRERKWVILQLLNHVEYVREDKFLPDHIEDCINDLHWLLAEGP